MSSACALKLLRSLAKRLRRTAGGHMEVDGKEAVCGKCGDRWEFRDRSQLPQWFRQGTDQPRLVEALQYVAAYKGRVRPVDVTQ